MNPRMREGDAGQLQRGLYGPDAGARFADAGVDGALLAFRLLMGRQDLVAHGPRLLQRGVRRVMGLGGHRTLPDQIAEALQILLRAFEISLGVGDGGALFPNAALLHLLVGLQTADLGELHLNLRLTLGHSGLEIGIIDDHQQVAGLHLLVVLEMHALHIARLARADERHVRLQIGIVGTFIGMNGCPPVMESPGRGHRQQHQCQKKFGFAHETGLI